VTRPARRRPKPDRRRALELLAASPDGLPEAIMIANGFTVEQLAELVRVGLASAASERIRAGRYRRSRADAHHRSGAASVAGGGT
jgi:hypothetical protein